MGVSRRSGLRWRERAELHRYEGKAPSSRPFAEYCLNKAIDKAKQNKTNWEETMIARRMRTLGRGFAKAGLPAALLVGGASIDFAQDCADPEALRFSMIPTEETTQELALYEPMVERLSAVTGKKVEFYLPTSYASETGRAHVCTPVTNAHLVCRLLLEQNT